MKVTVEFLSLPVLARLAGAKELEVDFPGCTVGDLLEYLCRRFGEKFRDFITDGRGGLEPTLRVMLNKSQWLGEDRLRRELSPGDRVSFMMMVGGG